MKLGCIIVLFNPDTILLNQVINSVKDQIDTIFIADNSTLRIDQSVINSSGNVIYHKMPGNIGIAAAQNKGIQYFEGLHFSHIIFLDQDSIVDKNLVSQIVADMEYLQSNLINIGAIGPRTVNRQDNKVYHGSVKKGKPLTDSITEVTELISTGTLVSLRTYKEVGLLDESLFIDGVDHEWCWRAAKKQKLRFFVSEKAILSHQLGEGDRFFIIRKIAISTPFRTYYQFRNYFILLRRNYVPIYWKLANGFKYMIKLLYYPIFIQPGYTYLKSILKGINDGIFNINKNEKQD